MSDPSESYKNANSQAMPPPPPGHFLFPFCLRGLPQLLIGGGRGAVYSSSSNENSPSHTQSGKMTAIVHISSHDQGSNPDRQNDNTVIHMY